VGGAGVGLAALTEGVSDAARNGLPVGDGRAVPVDAAPAAGSTV